MAVNKNADIDEYNLKGEIIGKLEVAPFNLIPDDYQQLISQAIRVYLANQRQGNASTKTRGEVKGSTKKIYRQKGTGRARHGSIKAPIFVGGGIVFGPRPKDFSLLLSKKMKKKSLLISLFDKIINKQFIAVGGLSKVLPKTKELCKIFELIIKDFPNKKQILLINHQSKNLYLASRNISNVHIVEADNVNLYEILTSSLLIGDTQVVKDLLAKQKIELKKEKTDKNRASKKMIN